MEKEQKKKLEEFLRTADELKKWLIDNGLDYIGGKIIERVCFSITKGKTYLCRKDVVMDSGEVAYREGVVYHSEEDGCLTDEQGTVGHVWTDGYAEYFVPYGEFEAGDWLWDDTLRIPLHVDEVHSATYRLTDNTGRSYCKPKCDVEAVYHKWDVMKDAERGDILIGKGGFPYIFDKAANIDGIDRVYCSCYIDNDNIPALVKKWPLASYFRPATNEEEKRVKMALYNNGYNLNEDGKIIADKFAAARAKMEQEENEEKIKEVKERCEKQREAKVSEEQPSGNLDGLYLYKHIHNNGITVSLKTSSEGDMMEIVGLSPRQRNVIGAIIECFAKE